MSKYLGYALAAVLALGGATALAQMGPDRQAMEFEAHRLHEACDHGDRKACVRFGMILGEHHELHEEWRRTHPEFFWWEH
jgi:hypothetical protein